MNTSLNRCVSNFSQNVCSCFLRIDHQQDWSENILYGRVRAFMIYGYYLYTQNSTSKFTSGLNPKNSSLKNCNIMHSFNFYFIECELLVDKLKVN